MDIYLVNSGPSDFYKPARPLKNALYHNNRDGTFTDVTDKAGVAGGTFGMGVAVGDYDNDGFPDMFVTAYGRSILYRNNGDGTFTDVTEKAGLAAARHAGLDDQRRVVRLRQRRPARSVRRQLRPVPTEPGPAVRGEEEGRQPLLSLLHSAPLQAHAERALPQQRRRDIPPGQRRRRPSGARPARRSAPSRPTSTTTASSIWSSPTTRRRTSCSSTAEKASGGKTASRQAWPSAARATCVRAWASTRQTSTATAGRTCSSPTSTTRCSRSTKATAAPTSPTARRITGSRRRRGSSAAGARSSRTSTTTASSTC